ncbi:IS30 family transposase [Micrococcus luteus]|nr:MULTISPECIES: IS30 family transposase [unclassified Micrococcus]MCV7455728.1 IS30 family transposase [Micrococcus luteus]MCV7557260.1 IS30 family transposase [Micrococcus luteus]
MEISTGSKAGWGVRKIASHLGRCPSVVSRELRPNSTKTRGYQAVTADVKAQRQRSRPQVRKVAKDPVLEARVNADLAASWMPNEIAGRLRLEAADPTVERMANSPDAQGRTVSGEAIYQYIYAIPRGELAKRGIFLQSKRTKRRPRTHGRSRGGPIVGMVPIAERGEDAAKRRVPGHWEGDLIIGKNGSSCAATLVERMSGFTGPLALPSKHAEGPRGRGDRVLHRAALDDADLAGKGPGQRDGAPRKGLPGHRHAGLNRSRSGGGSDPTEGCRACPHHGSTPTSSANAPRG